MRNLLACLVLMIGLLTGCSTTVYESIPFGNITQCDPAWTGVWQVIGKGSQSAPASDKTIVITSDCRILDTDGASKPLNVSLVSTSNGDYLVVRNDKGTRDCIGENYTHCGYLLLRFERSEDAMRVYFPDNARVSKAIADGSVKGYEGPAPRQQGADSEPTHRNFIAGDPREVARILRQHPEFFLAQPQFELRRAPTPAPIPPTAPADTLKPAVPAPSTPASQSNVEHP